MVQLNTSTGQEKEILLFFFLKIFLCFNALGLGTLVVASAITLCGDEGSSLHPLGRSHLTLVGQERLLSGFLNPTLKGYNYMTHFF